MINKTLRRGHDITNRVMTLMADDLKNMPPIDGEVAYYYQVRAAQKFGYFEPFNAEQLSLNEYLKGEGATKELTAKAWCLYHDLNQA